MGTRLNNSGTSRLFQNPDIVPAGLRQDNHKPPDMTVTVERLIEAGVLAPLHQAFADTIRRLDENNDPLVVLAAAVASEQLARGHVCLDLNAAATIPFVSGEGTQSIVSWNDWPAVGEWLDRLASSPLVELRSAEDREDGLDRPLVLDRQRQRVYLARYWFYQQRLASTMTQRLLADGESPDEERLTAGLCELFPDAGSAGSRDQCLAVANAVDRRFSVITGGPGTGKTTTVARLLALRLMLQDAPAADRQLLLALDDVGSELPAGLKVLLMAPTGKAAQRLNESLRRAASQLRVSRRIRDALQNCVAGTIHRLLGWTSAPPERGGPFRHNGEYPLDADVVLVDEASMVDIALMWRLFDAVKPDAQIILLGDHDQLASVEAGGVLSDLCGAAEQASCPESRCRLLQKRTGLELPVTRGKSDPLSASVQVLRHSHRFAADSLLGQLAAEIRSGNADAVIDRLRSAEAASDESVVWIRDSSTAISHIVKRACDGFRDMLSMLRRTPGTPGDVVRQLSNCRVLCAHREGRWGEQNLNRLIVDRLASDGLIAPVAGSYPGRAVMVTRNDYQLNLFNGDVGVIVRGSDAALSVLFEDPAQPDGCRIVPAALVRDPVDCFAMTIHKSQGSEFHRVVVVLPDHESPIVSRELLYTGVTRVRDEVDSEGRKPGQLVIAATEESLRQAVERPIRRTSGLRDAITAMGVKDAS